MNIAVCDDEEIQRSLLKGYLEAWAEAGSHALCISLFSTGRQFLESLKKTHFDIVLLDIRMPDMDGMSAAEAHSDGGDAGAEEQHHPRAEKYARVRGLARRYAERVALARYTREL